MLRFWESRFAQIRPLKRGGGRRYYRPDDVDLLRGVRHLLYGEGYTIRGVQRILREEGLSFVQGVWRSGGGRPPPPVDEDEDDEADAEVVREPSFFAGAVHAQTDDRSTRREPTLIPPMGEPVEHAGLDGEDRRKLQRVLEDLTACRSLIEAALLGTVAADNQPDDGG